MSTIKLNDKKLRETMRALYSDILKNPENKDNFDKFCQIYETHKARNSFFRNLTLDSKDSYDLYRRVAKVHLLLAKFLAFNGICSESTRGNNILDFLLDLSKEEFLKEKVLAIIKVQLQDPVGLDRELILLKNKILNEFYPELTKSEKACKLIEIIGDNIIGVLEVYPKEFLLDPIMYETILNKFRNNEIQISKCLLAKCIINSGELHPSYNEKYNTVIEIAIEKQMLKTFDDITLMAKNRPDLFLLSNYKKLCVNDWFEILSYYNDKLYNKDISEEYKNQMKVVISCFNLFWLKSITEKSRITELIKENFISYSDILTASEPKEIDVLNYNIKSLTCLEVLYIAKHNITNITLNDSIIYFNIKDNEPLNLKLLYTGRLFLSYKDENFNGLSWKKYFFDNFEVFNKNTEFTLFILSNISNESLLQFLTLSDLTQDLQNLILNLIESKQLGFKMY